MDIACPTCATVYEIDDATVGDAGRKVRCAQCATVWRAFRDKPAELISAPTPPPEAEGLIIVADPPSMAPTDEDVNATPDLPVASGDLVEASAVEQQEAQPAADQKRGARIVRGPAKPKGRAGGGLKALVSAPVLAVAATALLAFGAVSMREPIVRYIPHSAPIFAAVGVPVNLRGIDIVDVKSRMVDDNGVSILVIDGTLVSRSRERVSIPRLRFSVLGDRGQELYVWSAQADRATLQPGETLAFRRRLAAPPNDGRDVSVRFLSASDITAGLK
jgi:predicted Zn finger-like uncharacterized protein